MTNTALLVEFIEKSGYKRSYIAQRLDLTPYGFANKVNNKSEFKASEINMLCDLLHIDSPADKEAVFFSTAG